MTDRRRPGRSYGPEYGPLPPEHEYAMYHHLPSRGRPLHHVDYPGRLLEQRLRREPFGLFRHPLQPYAPFLSHHANGSGGSGATVNPRQRRENLGLTQDEFMEAMDQLRKQEYRPSNSQKKKGSGKNKSRSPKPEAPETSSEEEKACTICLEMFLPGAQVVVTPCNHIFHPGCITPWMKGHGNCPVCRSAICKRIADAGDISSSDGEDGSVDLDLLAMMRAMEEAFSRVRLSDFMSYYH